MAARFAYAEQKKTHNVYAVELNEEGDIFRATVSLSHGQLGSDPSLFSVDMMQLDEKSTKFFNDRSQFDLLTTNQARRIANSLYPTS